MQVYLGIDWSQRKHDAVFMNPAGASIAELCISHNPEGFRKLDALRRQVGVPAQDCLVGLETAHNLLVDYLWDRGYSQVYVVHPSDAFVVADVLRTDRGRLQPWFPDSLLTRQIRAKVSLIGHLTRGIVRLHNRLHAVLLRYYPASTEVFSSLSTQIAQAFIQAYPTPQAAEALTFAQFRAFALEHGYPNPGRLPGCFARLQAPQPEAAEETVLVYEQEAPVLAELLQRMTQAKATTQQELSALFDQHPHNAIFDSLPGAGDFLAPALLAKFGDDRNRFPTPSSLQALAGTCPVTKKSGNRKWVHFRYACDREFRQIAQQWARCSLSRSVWANAYWQRIRPHCHSKSHAYRCLANRWLAIAWKLWQTGETYDEAYHLRQCALRRKPIS
jgi:transposase